MSTAMELHRCRFVDYTPHTITALSCSHPPAAGPAPQDLRVAIGRSNGDIEIWDPRWSWVHETTLYGGRDRSIEGLAWTLWHGKPRLFSIGGSTAVTEWDLLTGLPSKMYHCDAGVVWSLTASPDGQKLAAGCDDGSIVIIDVSGGPGVLEYKGTLQKQRARVLSLAWMRNGYIIGGCADGRVRIWTAGTDGFGRLVQTMRVDKSQRESTLVWTVLALDDRGMFVTGDSTGSVKFWDATHNTLAQSFTVHEADVLCLAADAGGANVFSAGVDRKLVNYRAVASGKTHRWVNAASRLIHGNDVRAMACYAARGVSFLVSGGVERVAVVNSVDGFADGVFRKLPLGRQTGNVALCLARRYVYMWSDQQVKIWKLFGREAARKGRKLVAKVNLQADENVSVACISEDGSVLVVATSSATKVFRLRESSDGLKLHVKKLENEYLSGVGLTRACFLGSDATLVGVTVEQELIVVQGVHSEAETEAEVAEPIVAELPVVKLGKTQLSNAGNVVRLAAGNGIVAVARLCGAVDTFRVSKDGKLEHLATVCRLSSPCTCLAFTGRGTLLVVAADNRILELNVQPAVDGGVLTPWSKKNTDLIPDSFLSLVDKCIGACYDSSEPNRMWIYGANWLGFVDLSRDLPLKRGRGRKHDRLGVPFNALERGGSDGEEDEVMENPLEDMMNARFVDKEETENGKEELKDKAFWFSKNYRSLLLVDTLGNREMVLVERPAFYLPLPAAFKPKHKIQM